MLELKVLNNRFHKSMIWYNKQYQIKNNYEVSKGLVLAVVMIRLKCTVISPCGRETFVQVLAATLARVRKQRFIGPKMAC